MCIRALTLFLVLNGGIIMGVPIPEAVSPKAPAHTIILLEAPVSAAATGEKVKIEGNKAELKGRTFSGLNEVDNVLQEGNTEIPNPESTPRSYSIVVPVHKTFKNLEELFKILAEDSGSKPPKAPGDITYLKGSELISSEYTILFAR